MNPKQTKLDTLIAFISLWIARLALSALAVAGMSHLLEGVAPEIMWPVTVITVAFLLKETL